MARRGDVFTLHDSEQVTVRTPSADTSGELLELDAEWAPGSHRPLPHYHPKQAERFEVKEGELTVRLGDERRVLRAGESFEVPAGAVHSMWNSGDTVARALWQVRPALRTEDFFARVHELRAAGHTGEGGMLDKPAGALVVREFPDEFVPLIPMRGVATALGAAWARLRGI